MATSEIDAAVRRESEFDEQELELSMNKAVAPEKPTPEEEKPQPLIREKVEFSFSWTSGSGRKYEGTFTKRIASVKDQMIIGAKAAQFRSGMPVASLDPNTLDLSEMVATILTVVESVGERPGWFANLVEIHDVTVIEKMYEEVRSYWATFRLRGRGKG
jgi:hypothetical protein